MTHAFAALLLAATAAPPASADTPELREIVEAPPRNWANLRFGGSAADGEGRAAICLEVSPFERFGLEACGNGAGFLHREPVSELAHFRAEALLGSIPATAGTWLGLQLSAGIAELQTDEDEAGFRFSDTGSRGVETAGPEVGAAVRGLLPAFGDFELVGELRLDLAYLAHGPDLKRPAGPWLPSVSASFGMGF